jgi:hypothetical protein
MSWDIALVGGDFSFGPDGNPVTVKDQAKLAQDISITMLKPQGSDPGNAVIGTKLRGLIGRGFDFGVIQGLAAKTTSQALSFLMQLQSAQATQQVMTYLETLGSVDAIAVVQTSGSGIEVQIAVTSVAGQRMVFAMTLPGTFNT